ncbi:hypothetical protein V5O48_011901 [Marasmius crinis-equi]|uniref:FAD-binding PCMH-type domain-containing protein n=1 Tax=Marasmius crinis-equi TaxID=585013 RepID=A0ABR3F497_9AGAR
MDPIYLNKSCDPFDPRETPCRIGAYVQYAVNVSSPDHVIETVRFVTKHNIRFVVKNTGHDYMGRSTGTGAVSVWMHNLQDIELFPRFESPGYTGPAFKVNSGVLGFNLATEASREGFAVVSGECPTVGFAGGYIQGGGHSLLSSTYGLAADQALEFEVITAQGEFVRASPTENEDLYWALSGGGGGTYGIVWSVTVKAHQDLPVTTVSLNFTSEGITQDTFWKAIDAFQARTPSLTDAKLWASVSYGTGFFSIDPLFAVNKTISEVSALIRPLLDTYDQLGINYTSVVKSHNGYLDAYNAHPALKAVEIANVVMGTRLFPRSSLVDNDTLASIQATTRQIVEDGATVFEFMLRPTLEAAGYPQNAVLPAWRDAARFFGAVLPLVDGESVEQQLRDQNKITTEFIPPLKKLTPGSGAYVNEYLIEIVDSQADPNDPDWKETFYGPNYDRLLSIKDKWDPEHILYGSIAVGGDRWRETDEGRLCRVGGDSSEVS